jgi:hypothetical protein
LKRNEGIAFQGTVLNGTGFMLSKLEVDNLAQKNPANLEVISLYLRGEDFNASPTQSPSKYVINFRDWPLQKAQQYPDCLNILKEKVQPERNRIIERGGQIHEYDYWKFWDKRMDSYEKISSLDQVLFHSCTSKYVAFSFVPSSYVFAQPHAVIGLSNYCYFAVLQSNFHESWVRRYTSYSLSLARYTITDCFETFPFPDDLSAIETIGRIYFDHRQQLMLSKQEGLIGIYNRFHNPQDQSHEINELRNLHAEMDGYVAGAYGWLDLDFQYDFFETPRDG